MPTGASAPPRRQRRRQPLRRSPKRPLLLKTDDEDGEPAVVFTLTNLGGGIKSAELLQHISAFDETTPIVLNHYADHPIGALSREIGEVEGHGYQLVSKSDSEVVFEATTPDLIKVRKTYLVRRAIAARGRLPD